MRITSIKNQIENEKIILFIHDNGRSKVVGKKCTASSHFFPSTISVMIVLAEKSDDCTSYTCAILNSSKKLFNIN